MALPAVHVYFHQRSETPDFVSDAAPVAHTVERFLGEPGWASVPARDLAVILRAAGETAVADRLAAMEEPHVVRVYLIA